VSLRCGEIAEHVGDDWVIAEGVLVEVCGLSDAFAAAGCDVDGGGGGGGGHCEVFFVLSSVMHVS
jgi:hypothetical protein